MSAIAEPHTTIRILGPGKGPSTDELFRAIGLSGDHTKICCVVPDDADIINENIWGEFERMFAKAGFKLRSLRYDIQADGFRRYTGGVE